MRFLYKRRYLKGLGGHPAFLQKGSLEAERRVKAYCETSRAPFGLRMKKLGLATYEARVTGSLRILFIKEKDQITFALIGNHEEVRNYLKSY